MCSAVLGCGAQVEPFDGGGPRDAGLGLQDAGLAPQDAGPEPQDGGGQSRCARVPTGFPATERFARERTQLDQPDDEPGAAQVHVLYVEPADVTAPRALDVQGDLRRSLEAGNGWLAHRTGGARLRFDRCDGAIDITFVKEPSLLQDAVATGFGDAAFPTPVFIRDRLVRGLRSRFAAPNKLYLIVWDGLAYGHCGGASFPPLLSDHYTALFRGGVFAATYVTQATAAGATSVTVHSTASLPSAPFDASLGAERVRVAGVNGTTLTLAQPMHRLLESLLADTTIPPCRSNPLSADGVALGYAEFAALHEVMHTLGIVPSGAPDFAPPPVAPGHVGDSVMGGGDDLMYQGAQPWTCGSFAPSPAMARCVLDAARRNYFQVTGGTGVDLARSAFLSPTPPLAVLPPNW